MIIAIDGPAGSGKSSTADAVARRLGFHHLDSGALYRAVTWAALEAGIPVAEWPDLDSTTLDALMIESRVENDRLRLTARGRDISEALREPRVNASVSPMARVGAVRDWVNERLRRIAGDADVVADGRDIGTVVFPDAELKVFLVASPETRALRRLREQGVSEPDAAEQSAELERLKARDEMDASRSLAPLRQAQDAVLLDTTALSFDEQVSFIVGLARERGAGAA